MIDKLKKITVIPYEYIVEFLETVNPFLEIDINKPTFIIGDLHQDENSFFAILEATKFFEKDINLIFLGDFVDRGKNIWLINKILYLRHEFKDRVFILRGNHETSDSSKILPPLRDENGFFYQLEVFKNYYPEYITDELIEFYKYLFETFPIGIIAKYKNYKFFLTHANVARINLKNFYPFKLSQFLKLKNPIGISYLNDFVWNDIGDDNYTSKVRYEVSKDEVNYFLKKFGFDYVIRGHQYVKEGYSIDDRVITVFSTARNSPLSKEKNANSAYNGIAAVFELTRGKIYQVDIFLKKLIPIKKIYYTKFKSSIINFPQLSFSKDMAYIGDISKVKIEDLYTNKVKEFILEDEFDYNKLRSLYGIDIKFKIKLSDNFIINLSKKSILVDGKLLEPNKKMKIFYPLFVNHLKISPLKRCNILKLKYFKNYRVWYKDLRKKCGI